MKHAAGLISLELVGAIVVGLAELVLVGLVFWASWVWGFILLATVLGVNTGVVAVLFAGDPEGRGGRVVEWCGIAATVLLGGAAVASPIVLALRFHWLWWLYAGGIVGGLVLWRKEIWGALVKRWKAARAPAGGAP